MNPKLAALHRYPFEKLADLLKGVTPPSDKTPISLAIGEPKHAAPRFVLEELIAHLDSVSSYPATRGQAPLRAAMAAWATRRYGLTDVPLDPDRHILPVAGTREALFSIVQAVVDSSQHQRPVVIMPNPFYQIYEGAALLARAEPYYLNTLPESGFRMDFSQVPKDILARTQLVFICSPGNPTGAVMTSADMAELIALADREDFVIASDECYSEIYFEEGAPPTGLLQVAHSLGIADYRRCLVFHSLSKRSNLPGLRSGFVAGDGALLQAYLQYRTYQGAALPLFTQAASIKAWGDEAHVRENRRLYREKFDAVLEILRPVLKVEKPDASFYLWPHTPQDDETFARELYQRENVLVLPGSYLSRTAHGVNPGHARVRMALVASLAECVEAARRIRRYIESL
jgi:N-succinyldiaminopimelate aminotransferase